MQSYDLDGITVEDPENLFTPAMRRAMARGHYERTERQAVSATLRPGDRVLELGGGCGVIGVAAARVTGPGNVVSVEANPALIDTIRHTHAVNGMEGIRVLNGAASAEAGSARFYLTRNFWSSSLLFDGTPNIVEEIEISEIDVNALVAEHRANVLIADIEGGEFSLFSRIDWSPIELVIVELHPGRGNLAEVGAVFTTLISAGLHPDLRLTRHPRVMVFRREGRE
jgi:FkbM family methyltransferase